MSRPQKIIPPVKGGFMGIINAIADGKGGKAMQRKQANSVKSTKPSAPQKS